MPRRKDDPYSTVTRARVPRLGGLYYVERPTKAQQGGGPVTEEFDVEKLFTSPGQAEDTAKLRQVADEAAQAQAELQAELNQLRREVEQQRAAEELRSAEEAAQPTSVDLHRQAAEQALEAARLEQIAKLTEEVERADLRKAEAVAALEAARDGKLSIPAPEVSLEACGATSQTAKPPIVFTRTAPAPRTEILVVAERKPRVVAPPSTVVAKVVTEEPGAELNGESEEVLCDEDRTDEEPSVSVPHPTPKLKPASKPDKRKEVPKARVWTKACKGLFKWLLERKLLALGVIGAVIMAVLVMTLNASPPVPSQAKAEADCKLPLWLTESSKVWEQSWDKTCRQVSTDSRLVVDHGATKTNLFALQGANKVPWQSILYSMMMYGSGGESKLYPPDRTVGMIPLDHNRVHQAAKAMGIPHSELTEHQACEPAVKTPVGFPMGHCPRYPNGETSWLIAARILNDSAATLESNKSVRAPLQKKCDGTRGMSTISISNQVSLCALLKHVLTGTLRAHHVKQLALCVGDWQKPKSNCLSPAR